ncbi:MAG TPA: STAS domain-containing protein [Polyangiaceae bacterium]|jgi:rsbT co-antagonist protein RsbR|nr:STAS domain-containing protein [Polyangiaceae bacterium]
MNVDELMSENAALREQVATNAKIMNSIVDAVIVADAQGKIVMSNAAAEPTLRLLGVENVAEEWKQSTSFFRSDGVTPLPGDELPLARAMRGENVDNMEIYVRGSGSEEGLWLQCNARPMYAEGNTLRGAVVIFRDVNERKRWERDMEQQLLREREKNDLLERMRRAMDELSTPILEVWTDVLAVPVIGIVDSERASDMMARVLEAVERKQCRFLIIDITGVDVIDTATADRFLKLVTAAEILGAQCFLTGARAVVAQTLASLGMDLKGITTLRNLKHGISECMRAMENAARHSPLKDFSNAGSGRG